MSYHAEQNRVCVRDALERGHTPQRFLRACNDKGDSLADHILRSRNGLYIHGANGVGKTYLATAIMAGFIEQTGREVYFVRATGLSDTFRDFENSDKAKKSLDKMTDAPLLLIDDFDKAITGSAFILERLFDVIDSRYNSEQLTMFTSNCDAAALLRRFSDDDIAHSILSRIAEMTEPYEMKGDDRRLSATPPASDEDPNADRFFSDAIEYVDPAHPDRPSFSMRCKNGCKKDNGTPSSLERLTSEEVAEADESATYRISSDAYRCTICGEITTAEEIATLSVGSCYL